jgi:hypothetical protein
MVADTAAVKQVLLDVLPRVMAGEGVAQLAARHPWPPSSGSSGGTGLSWDV